jgi:hypothetical protein
VAGERRTVARWWAQKIIDLRGLGMDQIYDRKLAAEFRELDTENERLETAKQNLMRLAHEQGQECARAHMILRYLLNNTAVQDDEGMEGPLTFCICGEAVGECHEPNEDGDPGCDFGRARQELNAMTGETCGHDWVDVRNEAITDGQWCHKCNAVRATPDAGAVAAYDPAPTHVHVHKFPDGAHVGEVLPGTGPAPLRVREAAPNEPDYRPDPAVPSVDKPINIKPPQCSHKYTDEGCLYCGEPRPTHPVKEQ